MKKILIYFFTSCIIFMSLGIFGYLYRQTIPASKKKILANSCNKNKQISIAIVLPCMHPSLEKIQQGFIDTIKKTMGESVTFCIYNGNGNRQLLLAQAQAIFTKPFDLLFPITTVPAQLLKELSARYKPDIPIVYGAVSYPLQAELVKSLETSGNNLTGIVDTVPAKEQLDILFALRPSIKNILIVYDATHPGFALQGVPDLERIITIRGRRSTRLEIFNVNEVYEKVRSHIATCNAIVILKDNTVVSALDALVKLCNQSHVTLMTSDLDSVDRGAALGFGVSEYDLGVASAHKAIKILCDNKKPKDIASSCAENFHLKINKKTLSLQGLSIEIIP